MLRLHAVFAQSLDRGPAFAFGASVEVGRSRSIGVVGILESFNLLNNLGLQSLGRLLRLVEINPGAGE